MEDVQKVVGENHQSNKEELLALSIMEWQKHILWRTQQKYDKNALKEMINESAVTGQGTEDWKFCLKDFMK